MRRLLHTAVLAALLVAPVAAVGGAIAYDRAGLGSDGGAAAVEAHADRPPPGVDVRRKLSTDELYRKAGLKRPVRAQRSAAPDRTGSALATPPGTPALPVLSQHVEPSCTGDGTDGNRVQVVYAREPDMPDRLADVEVLIRSEVATVDDIFAVSSDATGGGRRVRWVADTSCDVSVLPLVLPDGSLGPDYHRTFSDVRAAGLNDPDRKYLLFSEGSSICGVGELYWDPSPAANLNDGHSGEGMISRVDQGCWSNPSFHSTAAHELIHNLGGVLPYAPNPSEYSHCTDEADLMCYDDDGSGPVAMRQVCPADQEQLLDCRKDDYFNTSPPEGSFLAVSWNTADSTFLDTVPPLGLAPRDATAFASRTSGANPVTVTATLRRTASGAAVAGSPVTLRTLRYGSTAWASTTGYTTDASGSVSVRVTPGSALYVQFVFAGDPSTAAASMSPVLVKTATRTSASAAAGSTTTLTGQLVNAVTGKALPAGQPVTLRVRPSGSSAWSTVTTGLRTDSYGRVVHRYSAVRPATFAFSHPGTASTVSSASPGVLVRVPTTLTMAVRTGRPNTLTGRLTTWSGTPLKNTAVSVQYRYAGTTTWRTAATRTTSSTGYVSIGAQPKRKTYYRWVYAGTATAHLASVSPSGYVSY